jgi:putative DNA primase/helicase
MKMELPKEFDSKAQRLANALVAEVQIVRGDKVRVEPIDWLWKGFLAAGKLHVLAGAPGTGKTTIALSLAAAITNGADWPDGTQAQQGDVLIWSGEDDPSDTLAPRLHAAGADMRRVHFIYGTFDGEMSRAFDPATDVHLLAERIETIRPRLLIVDPIVSAVAGDSHKGAEVRRGLQPIVDVARGHSCAVLGISHFSKGTAGRDPLERVTGSLAFGALARVVLVAAKVKASEDDEPRRVMARAKSNIGPDGGGFAYSLEIEETGDGVEGQRVRWLEALDGSARDVLAEAEADADDEEGTSKADVDSFLRSLLSDGPVKVKQLQADTNGAGYSWDQVKRASNRLGVEKRKESMSGGWVWALGHRREHEECEEGEGSRVQRVHPSVHPSEGSSEACTHKSVLPSHPSHPSHSSAFMDEEPF